VADFAAILAAAGERVSPGTLSRAYDASGAYLSLVWRRHRDVPVADHVRALLSAVDSGLPKRVSRAVMEMLVEAYGRPALLVPPAVDPGARGALEELAARGYALALVSNIMRTPGTVLRAVLERHRLLACFKQTTFSDEVGVRKPDPEIFALTLRALGTEAAAALHVGDDESLDVQGARAVGMRAILVTSRAWRGLGPLSPDATIARLGDLPAAVAGLEGEAARRTGGGF
jgi:HAD superfamily hydrolase (TIGR01509 family)